MNLEDKDIQCSSVSQLPPVLQSELTSDTLILVSQPDENTDTGYVSRFSRMLDVRDYLSGVYDLNGIHSVINRKAELSDLTCAGMITADLDAPYIISALSIAFGKVCDISGYRLSTGMNMEFQKNVFNTISAYDGYYESLSVKTTPTSNEIFKVGPYTTIKNSDNEQYISVDNINRRICLTETGLQILKKDGFLLSVYTIPVTPSYGDELSLVFKWNSAASNISTVIPMSYMSTMRNAHIDSLTCNYLSAYSSDIQMTGLEHTTITDTQMYDTDNLLQIIKKLEKRIMNIEGNLSDDTLLRINEE